MSALSVRPSSRSAAPRCGAAWSSSSSRSSLWEIGTQLDDWAGLAVPFVAALPPPPRCWPTSAELVLAGLLELVVPVAAARRARLRLGARARRRAGAGDGRAPTVRQTFFPVLETLRPIPPLAWVPLAIIFWPTAELSITFVTFLGAFFPIVLNTVGGADADRPPLRAGRTLDGRQPRG